MRTMVPSGLVVDLQTPPAHNTAAGSLHDVCMGDEGLTSTQRMPFKACDCVPMAVEATLAVVGYIPQCIGLRQNM